MTGQFYEVDGSLTGTQVRVRADHIDDYSDADELAHYLIDCRICDRVWIRRWFRTEEDEMDFIDECIERK